MKRLTHITGPQQSQRRGTSLSEVLVSTLIMSIGVVSLATLFPISVLRSIQASQLTNAANLRYNAEAQVRAIPELVNIGTEWQPLKDYAQGDVVVPTDLSADGRTMFVCSTAGQSAGVEPDWNSTVTPINDGVVRWDKISRAKYVVDPLGFLFVDPTDTEPNFRGAGIAGARQHFGNLDGSPFIATMNRFPAFGLYSPGSGATLNEYRAASAVVLPDHWVEVAESIEVANLDRTNRTVDLLGIDFTALSDAVSINTPDLVPDRCVLMDDTGRNSVAVPISGISGITNGTRVAWPTGNTLPTSWTPIRARIESQERRYSYMLSIRRGGAGSAHIDCIIFFRRNYSVQDEQVFSCVFRKKDTGSGDDMNFCVLQYSSSGLKPFFKKGGYVCDAQNLRWYRILDIAEGTTIASVTPTGFTPETAAAGMDRFVRLTLDKNVVEDSLMNSMNNPTPISGVLGGAILMRGIVDVFPVRPRSL